MNIKIDRFVIWIFELEDWKDVYEYILNLNVMKYILEGVFIEEDVKKFVIDNSGEYVEMFFVVLKDEKMVIGYIVFFKYFGDYMYEIGWVFYFDYQGKGYVLEAVSVLLGFGFKMMKLYWIIVIC